MKTTLLAALALSSLPFAITAQTPVPPPSTGQTVTGASSTAPRALPDGVFRFGGMTYAIKQGKADPIHRTEKLAEGLVAEENGKVSVKGGPAFMLPEGQHVGVDGKLSAGPFDTTIPGILGSPKAAVGSDKDPSSGAPMPKPSDTPKEFRKDSTGNASSSPAADKR